MHWAKPYRIKIKTHGVNPPMLWFYCEYLEHYREKCLMLQKSKLNHNAVIVKKNLKMLVLLGSLSSFVWLEVKGRFCIGIPRDWKRGIGLSAKPWDLWDWTADWTGSRENGLPSGISKVTPAKWLFSSCVQFQANSFCAIKSQTSGIITYLVGALYLQGHLNVKAVWGHTDWLFAVQLW